MTIRAGSLFNRFKSGAPTGWVAKLFAGEAPTGRKLVMQRFPDGSEFGGHWHQLLFFVNQRQPGAPEPTREVSPRVWGRFAKNRAKSAPPQRVALIALAHRHLRTAVRERDAAHMPLPASAK